MKTKEYLRFMVLNLLTILHMSSGLNLPELENFGLDLLLKLSNYEPDKNQIIAPFPIAILLILLRNNAEKDSAFEITEHLGLAGKSFDKIKSDYKEIYRKMERYYYFVTLNTINIHIDKKQTKDILLNMNTTIHYWNIFDICFKADDMLNIDINAPPTKLPEVEIMLLTQVYFKNRFFYKLAKKVQGYFNPLHGDKIEVIMIHHVAAVRFGEIYPLGATAIEVPYTDNKMFLVILIPNHANGLAELLDSMQTFPLRTISNYLNKNRLKLVLPTMKAEVKFSLNNIFEVIGMSSMFKRLCDVMPHIKVGEYMYKSSFNIDNRTEGTDTHIPDYPDENGDEGDVHVDDDEEFEKIPEIQVNRPFVFLIKSAEDDIMMMGKIIII